MNRKYGTRHWALVSSTYGEGKSTFIAANSIAPVYCIDSDGRFESVAGLIDGDVYYPTNAAGKGIGPTGPIEMRNQVENAVFNNGIQTIVADSVTRIFAYHARRASVAGRMTKAQRSELGFGKQKAADMIPKSDIMTELANLTVYGTDVYYTWHMRQTINVSGKYEKIEKDRISDTELATLMASIGTRLRFFREGSRFGITVDYCRDRNGRKSNVGFTIYDAPDNYWRGGAERLERLMYTSFMSPDEAVEWGMKQLNNQDPGEISSLYEFVKQQEQPKTRSEMAVAWIEHISKLLSESSNTVESPEKPATVTTTVTRPVPPPSIPPSDEEPLFPEEPETAVVPSEPPSVPTSDDVLRYTDGTEVGMEQVDNVSRYQGKFNKMPQDAAMLQRAIKASGDNW